MTAGLTYSVAIWTSASGLGRLGPIWRLSQEDIERWPLLCIPTILRVTMFASNLSRPCWCGLRMSSCSYHTNSVYCDITAVATPRRWWQYPGHNEICVGTGTRNVVVTGAAWRLCQSWGRGRWVSVQNSEGRGGSSVLNRIFL